MSILNIFWENVGHHGKYSNICILCTAFYKPNLICLLNLLHLLHSLLKKSFLRTLITISVYIRLSSPQTTDNEITRLWFWVIGTKTYLKLPIKTENKVQKSFCCIVLGRNFYFGYHKDIFLVPICYLIFLCVTCFGEWAKLTLQVIQMIIHPVIPGKAWLMLITSGWLHNFVWLVFR